MFRRFHAYLKHIGTKLRGNVSCLFNVSSIRRGATPAALQPTKSEHRSGPEPCATAREPPQQILQASVQLHAYIPPHLRANWHTLPLLATAHNISRIVRDYHEASRKFAALLIEAAQRCWHKVRDGWWPIISTSDDYRIQPLSVYLQLARVVSQHNAGALSVQMEHAVTCEIRGRRAAHIYYGRRNDLTEGHPGGHEHCIKIMERTKVILFGGQARD